MIKTIKTIANKVFMQDVGLLKAGRYWLPLCYLLLSFYTHAQSTSYNFIHITTSDGLSNAVVRNFAQDKYGYIWAGTINGLCRYDGYSVKVFLHSAKDSFSIPDNAIQALLCDENKELRLALQTGMYRYDYSGNRFIAEPFCRGVNIRKMISGGKDLIYCLTANGVGAFHPSDGSFLLCGDKAQGDTRRLLQKNLNDLVLAKNGVVYLATDTGLVAYDALKKKAVLIPVKGITGNSIEKINRDKSGNFWLSFGVNGGEIVRIDSSFSKYTFFPDFSSYVSINHISNIFVDNRGRVWVANSGAGICLYDTATNNFNCFGNNPLQPMSISSFIITDIFQDKDGFIWAGTEGYGISYFHPDNNLFHSILPGNDTSVTVTDRWSRAITEDKKGDLWMGSVNGVARYNSSKGTYSFISNRKDRPQKIYSNSVRSLLYDDHGFIWIGTAQGLNRFNLINRHMDFFGEKNGLPHSFFWTLFRDHNKNIWIGCRDGLFRFSYAMNKFENFEKDSLLAPYHNYNFTTIFEDSRQRLWFGTFKRGIIMLDEATGTAKHWMKDSAHNSFINNNIRSFAEDHNGTIWVASNEGIAAYDPIKNSYKIYAEAEGLKTLNTASLMVDKRNRLWVASGKGLYVLDSSRKYFKSFSLKDGLPSLEFNEQSAFKTSKGYFIYPALNGFLSFNPDEYKERSPAKDVYISSLKVFNKDYGLKTNIEELKHLQLDHDENFFTLGLTALNYFNPDQTWYAYKLEPFDKEWIFTKERLINYTNVPGGAYTFHYKASTDADNWNVPEKSISVHINTIFYNTYWFWALLLLISAFLLYRLYKFRIHQKEQIYSLKNKAQALEKEKAIVQYESLKQQLNPHFLFNSLTSLRSLIRIDKHDAADFLDKMSLNYRYILKSSESELVPLKDEIAFARGYCDMQQVRFGKGLQVTIDVGDDQLYKKIVPVTIQNLVENAIKHNLVNAEEPLKIDIGEETGYLVVRNNLQLKESVEASNQYGLKHLQALYVYLDKRPVIIKKSETDFIIKIPLI